MEVPHGLPRFSVDHILLPLLFWSLVLLPSHTHIPIA